MRFGWAAFEFRVELTSHKEAAGGVLHNLNKVEFRIDTRHNQPSRSNRVAVTVVELVAVTVALNNVVGAVGRGGAGASNNGAIVVTQTQRSAHIRDALLLLH